MIKTHTGNEYIRDANGELIYGLILRKSIRQQALTIPTSATKIPTSPLDKRINLLIMNVSTTGAILYIGNSSVTTANGFPVYPRGVLPVSVEDDIDIYGIGTADCDIRILEGA